MKKMLLSCLTAGLLLAAGATIAEAAEVDSVRHDLQISLDLQNKRLTGIDRMRIEPGGATTLLFFLSRAATGIEVLQNGSSAAFSFEQNILRVEVGASHPPPKTLQVSIRYAAVFDDPAPADPVNTDNPGYGVTGTIGEQGAFLLSGAGWYPHLEARKTTYRVRVEAPDPIIAVTAGRSLGNESRDGRRISDWQVDHPVQGLALSAAPFQAKHISAGNVTVSTYLLADNQHLADQYLEASRRYIRMYEDLFGPYPFPKFAVVENFFPTGYGFPSYTLLGGRVLRLPFIIHTSLGHEIAHCWWGNGVLADRSGGNWSEALTTYVADYLYKEKSSPSQALERRQTMLRNYASLVPPDKDFALRQFQGRISPATRSIGYDKGAMVFHMLRQRLGEDVFWQSLRDVYRRHLFEAITWRHFQQAFEQRGKTDLQLFFDQWIDRSGAPQPTFRNVTVRNENRQWIIEGRVVQQPPIYDLTAVLLLESDGDSISQKIHLSGPMTGFTIRSDAPPSKLVFDPQVNVFRRLADAEIPPSINSIKGAPSVLVVLADGLDNGVRHAARTLVDSLGLKNVRVVEEKKAARRELTRHDLLVVGLPRNRDWLPVVNGQVAFEADAFVLQNTSFRQAWDAFFGVGRHPTSKQKVAGIFLPLSAAYADTVARKVTHYGKYSYLAFSRGLSRAKGTWPVQDSPVIVRWPAGE